jgi:hypothetical protein
MAGELKILHTFQICTISAFRPFFRNKIAKKLYEHNILKKKTALELEENYALQFDTYWPPLSRL